MYQRKLTDDIINRYDIGYDPIQETLTFPQRDKNGNTLFIARRSVNTKYFHYPNQATKPLYGVYELYQLPEFPKTVYVCESMLDALRVCAIPGYYAVALNGLGSTNQFKELTLLPCRKLILATDNDEAGMKARQKIKQNVKNKILTQVILPPHRKDMNDLTEEEFLNLPEVLL
jgi:DNA primase